MNAPISFPVTIPADIDEAEVRSTVKTLGRYVPESVGAIKCQQREILAKLDQVLSSLASLHRRLDDLEAGR